MTAKKPRPVPQWPAIRNRRTPAPSPKPHGVQLDDLKRSIRMASGRCILPEWIHAHSLHWFECCNRLVLVGLVEIGEEALTMVPGKSLNRTLNYAYELSVCFGKPTDGLLPKQLQAATVLFVESSRAHTGRRCTCGKTATIETINTAIDWQAAYTYRIVCSCGLQTARSTAITDAQKLWDAGREVYHG